mmetsp:Transcript_24159/g.52783  ORF Transcript_24159/g.52783 Transcript_24159/m.52783 type:complete len:253 (+) Transcript_24159:44-802(+)
MVLRRFVRGRAGRCQGTNLRPVRFESFASPHSHTTVSTPLHLLDAQRSDMMVLQKLLAGIGAATIGRVAVRAVSTRIADAGSNSFTQLRDGTVYCVGRNYLDHIKELPGLLDLPPDLPTTPMIFIKSPATITHPGKPIVLPSWSKNVQHELELAVQLGENLQPVRAAVALDLSARDVQAELKRLGHPWALSKSFPTACPLGSTFSLEGVDVQDLHLELLVNGEQRRHVHLTHDIPGLGTGCLPGRALPSGSG